MQGARVWSTLPTPTPTLPLPLSLTRDQTHQPYPKAKPRVIQDYHRKQSYEIRRGRICRSPSPGGASSPTVGHIAPRLLGTVLLTSEFPVPATGVCLFQRGVAGRGMKHMGAVLTVSEAVSVLSIVGVFDAVESWSCEAYYGDVRFSD